ncbi:aspartyl-phosphate phosphatase Spo0E family protein [Serpentinicella alkaliphila]|uniref:Spo0E like sporulation regulatory protein n=1 Tax=Serpentinicella alkaliphila TaxID=1734049 RepID=A0A4R2TP98_9FIRM|nr:aspartyl-phosphate phosphatase Spo0E family protein [Serpentinicella alkaliphila]QUH24561.1 aspartyl-phosphate phosphatase Spo0E family protein [Serpentinicella alkaliphila]TCQ04656.1 Spo0E like sporulation regulatory protein [Serpentinicella alkaliphila]
MKKKKACLNLQLEQLREELNQLIELNNGIITKQVVELSQKLDIIIVEAMRNRMCKKSSNF